MERARARRPGRPHRRRAVVATEARSERSRVQGSGRACSRRPPDGVLLTGLGRRRLRPAVRRHGDPSRRMWDGLGSSRLDDRSGSRRVRGRTIRGRLREGDGGDRPRRLRPRLGGSTGVRLSDRCRSLRPRRALDLHGRGGERLERRRRGRGHGLRDRDRVGSRNRLVGGVGRGGLLDQGRLGVPGAGGRIRCHGRRFRHRRVGCRIGCRRDLSGRGGAVRSRDRRRWRPNRLGRDGRDGLRGGRRRRLGRRRLRGDRDGRAGGPRLRGCRRVADRERPERVDIPVLVGGPADAEMDVRLTPLDCPARPDRPDAVALGDRRALIDRDGAEVSEGHRPAVRRLDRHRPAVRHHRAGERDDPCCRRAHEGARGRGDVDAAVLAGGFRDGRVEGEGLEDGAVDRPGPRARHRNEDERS